MLCHWQNFLSIHGDTQQLQKHIGGGGGEKKERERSGESSMKQVTSKEEEGKAMDSKPCCSFSLLPCKRGHHEIDSLPFFQLRWD